MAQSLPVPFLLGIYGSDKTTQRVWALKTDLATPPQPITAVR
jgi:hypothetical protein